MAEVFEKIPVYIVKQEDIGLLGAFVVAQQQVDG